MPYRFRPDTTLLDLDAIEVTEPLTTLLADVDHGQEVTVLAGERNCSCRFDRRDNTLQGSGLAALMQSVGGPVLCVEWDRETGPVRLRLWPLASAPAAAPLDGEAVAEEKAGAVGRILGALAREEFSPQGEVNLRSRAEALLYRQQNGELLSLQALGQFTPFPYQTRTAQRVIRDLRGRALLCDEVGLGKTVEAGLILLEYILRGLTKKILILAPPGLVAQWQEEMRVKFNLDFMAYDSPEFQSTPDPWRSVDRIIASIHTAKTRARREEIEAVKFDLVIVDEAHHLKNRHTLAWELVDRLQKKYILLLTATPIQNDLEELFNLITLLQPGQLATPKEFKKRFVARGDALTPKNTRELQRLIQAVMIRNRRSTAGVALPRRRAETVHLTLQDEERALYDGVTAYVRQHYAGSTGGMEPLVLKALQREAGSSAAAVAPTLLRMTQAEGARSLAPLHDLAVDLTHRPLDSSKVRALLQLLAGLGEPAVVFTGFRQTQRFLADVLAGEGLRVVEFHGGLRREEKEQAVATFAGGADVLLCGESGSEGRNLQFCRMLINYDLPWNPMRIEQRIGRLHRIGQTREVQIFNLSAAETVEAQVLQLLDAKINLFELVVGELDMILGDLEERRDFEDLIMDIWCRGADPTELAGLGEELAERRRRYLEIKRLDEALLGKLAESGVGRV